MCQFTETALKGFLAQKFKDENDCSDATELDRDIEAGQKAAETVSNQIKSNKNLFKAPITKYLGLCRRYPEVTTILSTILCPMFATIIITTITLTSTYITTNM